MARIRPRSIKEGFKFFFKLFLTRVGLDEHDDPDLSHRFIEFDSRKDLMLFSRSVIKAERKDSDGKMTFLIKCKNEAFYITLGYQSINMPSNVIPIDISVGLFLLVVLEREIKINSYIDNLKILNEIIVPIENEGNQNGYDLETILKYFPEINVSRITEPIHDYSVMLDKLSIMMYCENRSLLRLNMRNPDHGRPVNPFKIPLKRYSFTY